jgi:dienelactone hydrolase
MRREKTLARQNMESPAQFGAWRKDVLAFYRKTMRIEQTRKPVALDTAVTESIPIGDNITRRGIAYGTTDGLRIPAYLFVPKTERPVPVIIVYHGHGAGKINAAECEGTNENALAKYLAEKLGYVVLAPDSRSFGEFAVPGAQSHAEYFSSLISNDQSYTTKLMEDGFQDMALLRSIPEADMERAGVAGVSMGCWRALNHSALHDGIGATVLSALFLPWEIFFSEKHCRCQHVPALASEIGAEELAATIFPRDIMIQWGLDDKYYGRDAEELITRVEKIAGFLGLSDHLAVDRHPGMGHMFSNAEIAGFFHKRLGDGAWRPQV